MPKAKRQKRTKHDTNLFFSGFITGLIFGFAFSVVASGHSSNPLGIMVSRIIILVAFVSAIPLTVYNAYYGKPFIDSFFDGLVVGIGLSAQLIDWVLNGIHIP